MSNIRLIISDIDGTILTSNHQVDEQLIEVMPELERANIPFVLASARSPLGMQPIAHKLGLHDNPIACYNGALVLEGDRTIIQHPVDKAEIQDLLNYLSYLTMLRPLVGVWFQELFHSPARGSFHLSFTVLVR